MTGIDNKNFYEAMDWEAAKLDERLSEKIKLILDTIPKDVTTILDIGCGDGSITNVLNEHYDIIGLERSPKALGYVKTEKIQASCDAVPFPDNSFDMIFSSELIEHLEQDVFDQTIAEMTRLSKKYIFLTFPNSETLAKDHLKCPNCSWIYNRAYHLQSLDVAKILQLFPNHKHITDFAYGKGKRGYNKILLKIKHALVPATSWLPKHWLVNDSLKTMCPKCEHAFEYRYKFNILGFILDSLNTFLSPHKPYWLFVLLEKKHD